MDEDFLVFGRRGPGRIDQMIVDWYTIFHFLTGVFLSWTGLFDFYQALTIAIIFEIWENSQFGVNFFRSLPKRLTSWWPTDSRGAKHQMPDFITSQADYVGDSWGNMIFDVLALLLGWYLF